MSGLTDNRHIKGPLSSTPDDAFIPFCTTLWGGLQRILN